MLKLIEHLTAKSKGLRWGTGYLFVIFTSPLGPIIIYPGGGEVEDFRGSHDFQGERGGIYGGPQLSRQNKKSRHYKLYSRQNKIYSRQNKIYSRQNKENELVSGCYFHLKWYVV